jgi:DNA mismatch repair protein MutS2
VDEHALEVLEFPKLLELLAGETSFPPARERALALVPVPTFEGALERLRATAEMLLLERMGIDLPTGGLSDVRPVLQEVGVGQVALPGELLATAEFLRAAMRARDALSRVADRVPRLWELAAAIGDFRAEVRAIEAAITRRGEVADNASEALAAVRRQLRQAQERLDALAQSALADALRRGIAQEPLVTERNGRKVLPIKAEHRAHLPGIVHDVSSSGATVFIEPAALVEAGNVVRELQLSEEREVRRVLQRLGGLLAARLSEIAAAVDAMAELDLLRAKVRLGRRLGAELPAPGDPCLWLAADGMLDLRRARHPLLRGEPVPIDVSVGGAVPGLLITGPNTGGKTVALKTIGLLTLMAQAGIPIPCSEGSRLVVFERVYADIGDEQSIEQSLSTFSSHMRQIIGILRRADARTLVLLDELGAGTDPAEGSAIARAVLEALLDRGATVVATTHHAELKLFAHGDPRVRNAAVEFDPETLAPTYRLTIGVPGQSNAFAIARRLGLEEAVLERARTFVSAEHQQLEQLLADLRREREQAAALRELADREAREIAELRRALAEQRAALERERAEILVEAHRRAAELVDEAEREVARLRRRMERERFDPGEAVAALRALDAKLEAVKAEARPKTAPPSAPRELAAGDLVYVRGVPQPGRALGPIDAEGRVELQFGSARMRVTVDRIERVEPAPGTPPVRLPEVPRREVPLELDVRGQRADEALARTEMYLDDAFRAGLPFVRIIHGKGSGALRAAIREALASHPLVRRLETPAPHEGGEGVTIAVLAG